MTEIVQGTACGDDGPGTLCSAAVRDVSFNADFTTFFPLMRVVCCLPIFFGAAVKLFEFVVQ